MTKIERMAAAMAAKRAELINQPLAHIWKELAEVCEEIHKEDMVGTSISCTHGADFIAVRIS
jgi:hypothetical protein